MKKCFLLLATLVTALSAVAASPATELLQRRASAADKPLLLQANHQLSPKGAKTITAKTRSRFSNSSLFSRRLSADRFSVKTPAYAPAAAAESSSLRGLLIYDEAWGNNSAAGIYSLSATSSQLSLLNLCDGVASGAFTDGSTLYVCKLVSFWGFIISNDFIVIDETSGDIISQDPINDAWQVLSATYVPGLGSAVASGIDLNTGDYKLLNISCSGRFSEIASMPFGFSSGMTVSKDGTIYGMTGSGDLYTVNTSTGALTKVGSSGVASDYITSIVYDDAASLIYYPTSPESGLSGFYAIDPATATATKRYDFETNNEFGLLYVPAPAAADKAPAAVSGLSADFADGSLSGSISFLPPTTTYDGAAASGPITWTVAADGLTLASGSTTFGGAEVKADVTVPSSGSYRFDVYCSNSTGDGAKSFTRLYIGSDTPSPVSDVKFEYADGKLNVSWSAPTGIYGGYFDPAEVTYKVIRYTNEEPTVAAEALKGVTSFSENYKIPTDALQTIYYSVVPTFAGNTAAAASSTSQTFGTVVPPYEADLSTPNAAAALTIIDNNDDGRTWGYDSAAKAMYYAYSGANNGDDYLVLPAARLEKGKLYLFSFTAAAMGEEYPERIAAYVGRKASADALTTELLAPTTVSVAAALDDNGIAGEDFSLQFIPQEDGDYYFALKACSDVDQYYLYVSDIAISAPTDARAPAAVTGLSLSADPRGEPSVTISFTAPSLDATGNSLSSLSDVSIYCDDRLVKKLTPAPGAQASYTDTQAPEGEVTYLVIPSNEYGEGVPASAKTYVGLSVPAAPASATAAPGSDFGELVLTWSPVTTDINGRPLTDVTYAICQVVDGQYWEAVQEGLTECTCTLRACAADAEQTFVQYGVFPVNDYGTGSGLSFGVMPVGAPFTLPYTESFTLETPLGIGNVSDGAEWSVLSEESLAPQDGDGACALFTGSAVGDSGSIFTARIMIDADAENPEFSYYYYGLNQNDHNKIQVIVNDGSGFVTVGEPADLSAGLYNRWNRVAVSLDAYKGKAVQVGIRVDIVDFAQEVIDNMCLKQNLDHDLTCDLSAPAEVKCKETLPLTAYVSNLGGYPEEGYSVTFYVDFKPVATIAGEPLAAGATKKITYAYEVSADAAESLDVCAIVNCPDDADYSNNSSKHLSIAVESPDLPAVTDLGGTSDDSSVNLSWSAPDYQGKYESFTEDFESLDSFATMDQGNAGGWTFLDLDQSPVGGFNGVDIPNVPVGEKSSFFVLDNSSAEFNSTYATHSGTKCLAVLFNYDSSKNDDWAISPELSGAAQTISFFARAYSNAYPETLEVLYSSTDRDPESFTSVETFRNISTDESCSWTQYSFEVPAGAKYFALRFISEDTFMLMIDDVTYAAPGAKPLELTGYNVYRDGIKLNAAPLTETSYTDSAIIPYACYTVTALYTCGESGASNRFYPNGVSGIETLTDRLSVRGLKGEIAVKGETTFSIYDLQGRLIYSGGAATVPALPGAYIVSADGKNLKVIVK